MAKHSGDADREKPYLPYHQEKLGFFLLLALTVASLALNLGVAQNPFVL
jgi:hypothetical protein